MFKYIAVIFAMLLGLAFGAPNPAPVASPNPNPSIVPLGYPLPLGHVVVGPRIVPAPVVLGPLGHAVVVG